MRKKLLVGIFGVTLVMAFGACGEKSFDNENAYVTNTQSVTEADYKEEAQEGLEVTSNTYEFEFDNKVIAPDMAFEEELFGKAKDYFEAPSCAFEGLDKIFSYDHFEIHTYPDKEKDCISLIWLMDDLVSTKEGISIGMTLEEVTAAYGEAVVENDTYTYQKGNMELVFEMKEGKVSNIMYYSKAGK